MSRVRFHAMEYIAKHPGIDAVFDGPNFNGWKDVPTSVNKHKPDFVFWYKPLDMPGYDKISVPKIISYNEMWNVPWSTEEITKSKSDIIICHHENDMKNYDHLKDKHKLVHIHHCADRRVFKDYGLPKAYDLLLVGVVSDSIYPLRGKLKRVMSRFSRSRVLTHPGYKIGDVNKQVIQYAKEINRAKIVLTCSSKYKYALAKYSEVPLCKTLLMADIPDERQDFFRSFVAEVNENLSEDEIANRIRFCLEKEHVRYAKIQKGYELTLKTSTQEHYSNNFYKILKEY
jgi:hypothetical protein